MNTKSAKALATKITAKVESWEGPESKGFVRWMSLSDKIRKKLMIDHIVSGQPSQTFPLQTVVPLFGSMTIEEFQDWIISAA
jgi:hypothetical protein